MSFFTINREERHFGFLFMSMLLSNKAFRERAFKRISNVVGLPLSADEFDMYAEIAIFRDHWFSYGDPKVYSAYAYTHNSRLRFLKAMLKSMAVDERLIWKNDLFWTGKVKESKLWFPGKWNKKKLSAIEENLGIGDKKLFRCRWLCNAKPDLMIKSGNSIAFIEIKVESGLGSNDLGYSQEQSQNDIINIGINTVDWMRETRPARINLWHEENSQKGITWKEVVRFASESVEQNNVGEEMILRHLLGMPQSNIC